MKKTTATIQSPAVGDIWTMTREEAEAAGIMCKWLSAQHVLAFRAAVEAGDGGAIMHAMAACAAGRQAAPDWLAMRFCARVAAVDRRDVDGWGEAFNWPGPTHPETLAKAKRLQATAWPSFVAVEEQIEAGKDRQSAYKAAAKRLGIGEKAVAEGWRLVKKLSPEGGGKPTA